jgi:plastocyanin
VYKSRLLKEQFEIIVKKDIVDISIKLPLVLVTILAIAVSGTSSLLVHYTSENVGNRPAQFAYGASSDSVFGDVPASTDSDDSNSDDSKQGGSNNNNNNTNNDDNDKESSKQVTTSSGSDIAPQAKTGSTISNEDDSNSSADTSSPSSSPSGTKDVSMTGVNQDYSFDPNPIEISAGESVTWTNNDNEIHDITSGNEEEENMGQEFASGILSSGKSFSHTFDKPGRYPYLCSFHESMTGEVIVK